MASNEWPELSEELGRKALEALSDRLHVCDQGEISPRELRIALDAIYDVIAGLAPWEDTNAIYDVIKELKSDEKAAAL